MKAIVFLIALAGWMLIAFGCEQSPTVGWDPATMRCRTWEDGKPTGPFLMDEDCAGQEKPVEIQPEAQ